MAADPVALHVAVLGPVRAFAGDREVVLGPARQRAVFAVLAASANRPVGRDALIAAVWGDAAPATAVGNVYTYVSGLRRALGPAGDALASGAAGYTLRLGPGALDRDRFTELCAEADRHAADGATDAAAAALDAALGLWHGAPFDGLPADVLQTERAHLAARRLAAIEQRARIALDRGDDGLVADLAELVQTHPLHEPLRELLMLALHRAGRNAEALEVFRAARRTLQDELGVAPGPGLTELHRRITTAATRPARAAHRPRALVSVLPTQVARAARDGAALSGRRAERDRLHRLVTATAAGRGAAVWIEGEPGIGKTALLTVALAGAGRRGCHVAWAAAEELDRDVPLQVLVRALDLEAERGDADLGAAPAAERVLARVRALCAGAPLVLVVDDMQWADDATRLLWDRLVDATRHLPLLLVAATRPEPGGRELAAMRRGVQAAEGHVLRLDPLPPDDLADLVAALVGAPLGPHLSDVVPRSAGNPLCAVEMTTGLLRRGVVRVHDGRADIDASVPVDTPPSVLSVVRGTVDFLTEPTRDTLRMAALLGTEFAVHDVVAVTGRPAFELMSHLEEALGANVVVDAGNDLAFRHPFLRQALYESIPAAVRATLHRHTAEVLAHGGSPVTRVAKQLAAAAPVVDTWVTGWLTEHHATLMRRSPQIARSLLRQVLDSPVPDAGQRETLLAALVRLDFRHGRHPTAEATRAMEIATDPEVGAEMRHLLAAMRYRDGDTAAAIDLLAGAVTDPDVPELWRAKHRVLLATFRRGDLADLDAADRRAGAMYAQAIAASQPYEAAFALQTGWLTNSIRRRHDRALDFADRALDHVRDHPRFAGLYFHLLDNRIFTLQNLDRLDEAERTLHEAALFAIRHRLPSTLQVTSAVQHYWLGRWDDASAEVGTVTEDGPGLTLLGSREAGAVSLLLHGVAALIAAHRDDATLADAHLDAADTVPATDAERESSDFLVVARALRAEQQGRPEAALAILEPLLEPEYAPMMLRHQWLPGVVRLALATGRTGVAQRAAAVCRAEADKESRRARAWAADARCRALLTGDPEPALAAAAHYRTVGRLPERAAACEDAAVLLAAARRPHEAAAAGAEAARCWERLRAGWDLRRTVRRLAEYGVEPADVASPAP